MNKAFFARVSGRVQGVGFRYACLVKARSLEISGWVRNTADGDVEVWAEGGDTDALLEWLHEGPPHARVVSVDFSFQKPKGFYKNFLVRF
ncbi:MAG: acylphosphatase [Treponema sp.]|nr:acylphosphatase [Treponema sp.]MDR1215125.1 acylphosphatase [Treponema sp.]